MSATATLFTLSIHCAAHAAYHEARGEPDEYAMSAVIEVVINRSVLRNQSICEVVNDPKQFSFVLRSNSGRAVYPPVLDDYAWERARALAGGQLRPLALGLRLEVSDTFGGDSLSATDAKGQPSCPPTHYANVPLAREQRGGSLPAWLEGPRAFTRTGHVEQHTYYTEVC